SVGNEVNMMNDKGYAEIGYVFTYLASAMVLASVIGVCINMTMESRDASTEIILQDAANRIAKGIDNAVYMANAHPNSSYNTTVSFPSEIRGSNAEMRYAIEVTNDTVYINASDGIRVRSRIHNFGNINISGEVKGSILVREYASGGMQTIKIIWDKDSRCILVWKA
ncbi:MAG: hypothetical protein KJ655_02990, partial [Candidatus Thermoplasmatota archaeon]|nr:hypothetical protein [Candidatus Thermoplasmatota archaeon]